MISTITVFGDEAQRSVFDRPGSREVARLNEETIQGIEAIDSPADLLADAMHAQVASFDGEIPKTKEGLARFVVSIWRSAAGPTAVSAMLQNFIAVDEGIHIANAVRRMLVIIRSQAKPGLTCDAIAIAMGIHIGEGRSLEEIAKSHGITKQALSKRAIRICNELGLPPSVLMRSEESRESYRRKQCQRHDAARQAGLGIGSIETLKAKLSAARQHVNGKQLKRISALNYRAELIEKFA